MGSESIPRPKRDSKDPELIVHRSRHLLLTLVALLLTVTGCAKGPADVAGSEGDGCASMKAAAEIEQAQRFREAETERAMQLIDEIERLQADLATAEAALVEAESGLAASHSRADAVSSIAETRIEVDRAETRAPWRASEISYARAKLLEAERQVRQNRFGAALFFVYRARRVAESILAEARIVQHDSDVQIIRAPRVNLRAGPSANEPILAVLNFGTPIFPQATDGDWMLVQVSAGPVGWIHRRLVEKPRSKSMSGPAAIHP